MKNHDPRAELGRGLIIKRKRRLCEDYITLPPVGLQKPKVGVLMFSRYAREYGTNYSVFTSFTY